MTGFVLPAGTTLQLRTVSRIQPDRAFPSEGFGAVIAGDVHGGSGELVFGSGAPARLVIRNEGLALAAVMIYGTWYSVAPASGDTPVGGGALLGTLTRGVMDTPRPGSASVESMAIRTTGPDLQVPAGALLIFRLDAPAQVGTAPAPLS